MEKKIKQLGEIKSPRILLGEVMKELEDIKNIQATILSHIQSNASEYLTEKINTEVDKKLTELNKK